MIPLLVLAYMVYPSVYLVYLLSVEMDFLGFDSYFILTFPFPNSHGVTGSILG